MLHVLLVDDDPVFRKDFAEFAADRFVVSTADGFETGLAQASRDRVDAVLLDIDLGGTRTGLDLLAEIRAKEPDLPIIMVSAEERDEVQVEAHRAGADGYFRKSFSLDVLQAHVERMLQNVLWRQHARDLQRRSPDLVGASPAMEALRAEIVKCADSSARVLIRGETGVGKELVARAIHNASRRKTARFVDANMSELPDSLFDDELFGHEPGAYTDAKGSRDGLLELADGGTLFLDEIAAMSMERQSKLLRVIERGEFRRIGGREAVKSDVRFVTATNVDLEDAIERGAFAHDLFFRIAEVQIRVPPLRERLEDLPLLARTLVDRICRRDKLPPIAVLDGALECCYEYGWPGNVREFETLLKQCVIESPGGIHASVVVQKMDRFLHPDIQGSAPPKLREALRRVERAIVRQAMTRNGGNASAAAEELGVSRAKVYKVLEEPAGSD